ncbi:AHL_G0012230.mRNA.1.CDS.1 [Saccharomyces cerevisiae]|nr:ATM_1a_G0012080.mRNA.1.CDS.1 [Saccharomyces cerevisiae]CAI4371308.1 AMP_1a_G0010780.mRNA.1.CDS.1 [Saccharomyces cerevisiae]CAI4875024.1 AHL_G0012230.mRNA.1.CDS.1 [Saccharomyces cerevisiae]CAI5252717.1 CKB_HP2_G0011880.mRNA.1.CDS.1 [Saccharomyces cerevisiae]CAI6441845.1 CKB_HP2_G0011880.mRNA.1.CDS.1 [Saccharomyces cerevisiae]
MVTIGSSSPGIISFLRSFCTDHLYSFTQIFPLVVHFFFRRLLKRDALGTIKNIGSQTYINIYVVYVYILHICFNNLGSIAQKRKYNSVSTMPREDD